MKLCKRCGVPMVKTFSFSPKANEKFFKCRKCYGETIHVKLREKDLLTTIEEEVRKDKEL